MLYPGMDSVLLFKSVKVQNNMLQQIENNFNELNQNFPL